jgi:hypothetical protein
MNSGADVKSLAVLHDWYAAVVEFRAEAQDSLSALAMSLQRAAAWLTEQQGYWQREIRAREEDVAQAQTELRTRRIPNTFGEVADCTVQEKALRRAKAQLEESEERLAAVRRWMMRLPREICDNYQGPAGHLTAFLDSNLPSGLALLSRQLTALEKYVQKEQS